ncbi:uncharacterized protein EV154DRAFT_416982 [Mucor mucedo]|uniref:uncharacterized protein n=1 Tax=Mucor mucedo TaxID=29922 RepID=UPI00221FE25C|nr:uncharacterized protein EV154DRAFT_416982 [Mucor mucedo]KAI7893385.1 hypothetical protein EV154DRAFT_416982 [Mucor mucedo]
MLSTRFNQLLTYDSITKKSSINQSISLPITPPTDDDEDDDEEEDWNSYDDPHLLPRPSNPISSVLDGNYFDINYNRKASTTSTTSSSSIDQPQEIEEGQVRLRTKGSGFLRGHFSIPHDHVLNWAQEQNQCDARLIKIQSVCIENNKFSPNHNVVSLIEPTGISIISDIDDTIKDTQIKAGARTVLSKTFFEPTKGVTGMADAYMSWYSQGASFHYVSNSPFQLMPMLDSFIRDSQFPPGSMHLRDDGKLIARLVETPGQAKREAILDILRDFPHRHFILIGDSGEIDLEIYTRIAIEYPEQILKIYIRDVTTPTRTELQQSMTSVRQKSSLSSLFYPKRRSQSEFIYKKKHRSPLGMRRAVTTMLAEYAVEPHLTGHRSTLHIDDTGEQNLDGLLDPLRFQKVSSVEACAQLYHRLEKARNRVAIDIILFQDPDTLRRDTEITNSLWDMWDDQSNLSDPL